jgi:hypothetical protein
MLISPLSRGEEISSIKKNFSRGEENSSIKKNSQEGRKQ